MLRVPSRLLPVFLATTRPGNNLVHEPVPARVSAGQPTPRLAITAGHHRGRRVSAPKLLLLHFSFAATTAARCLTPRSSRAPTACHAGPAGGTRYIFASRACASHRRCRVNSNVRQRKVRVVACRPTARPSGLVFTYASSHAAGSFPASPSLFSNNAAGQQPRPSASACPRERGPTVTAACHHRKPPPWLARERAKLAPAVLCLHPYHRSALPNPSLKRSANGRPPGPVWRYAVHFRQPGPGVLPSPPA